MLAPHPTWQDIAAEKKQTIDDKIPPEWRVGEEQLEKRKKKVVDLPRTCGLMTDRELSITELSAVEILAAIQTQKLTAVETTAAFCKRAAIAHQAVRYTQKHQFHSFLLGVEYATHMA
jgi:amidase